MLALDNLNTQERSRIMFGLSKNERDVKVEVRRERDQDRHQEALNKERSKYDKDRYGTSQDNGSDPSFD